MRTELLRATGATSVYVTHDQVEAMTIATHVAVMRDGLVEQFCAPLELLERPASPLVAAFVGTPPANLLAATVEDGRRRFEGVALTDGTENALLTYRPDHLALAGEAGARRVPMTFAQATPVAGRA